MIPTQLLTERLQIANILRGDLKIPVKFDENNTQEIFKILKVEIYSINDRIIFLVQFSLCVTKHLNVCLSYFTYLRINK